jgi:hypothetical protein
LRGIVGYIFFFTIGVISAGAYFYQMHPEQSFRDDLPRMRQDISDVIERGKRLRDAWEASGTEDDENAEQARHEEEERAPGFEFPPPANGHVRESSTTR